MLKTQAKIFIHGFIIVVTLAISQVLLDIFQISFYIYSPPIGFAFFLMISYVIQPMLVGALNVALLQKLYKLEGWITEFWINGILLMLTFSTINMVLQTITNSPFSPTVVVAEVILLAYPFGHLGRLSNRGFTKT